MRAQRQQMIEAYSLRPHKVNAFRRIHQAKDHVCVGGALSSDSVVRFAKLELTACGDSERGSLNSLSSCSVPSISKETTEQHPVDVAI